MAGILAIIPARGGSKGLKNKNTQPLARVPLIAYTIRECEKSKHLQRCIVSTDTKEVASVAGMYDAKVLMRPAELARDDTPMAVVVKQVLEELKSTESYEPNLVVVLQPTSPLRQAKHIDQAIEKMEQTGADSVVSVCLAEHSPYWMVKLEGDKAVPFVESAPEYTTRQSLPPVYRLNGAIYVLKPHLALEQDKVFGGDMRAIIMSEQDSVDVNTWTDLRRAEAIIKERKKDILR